MYCTTVYKRQEKAKLADSIGRCDHEVRLVLRPTTTDPSPRRSLARLAYMGIGLKFVGVDKSVF
jgi:hypothetical protein